MNQQVEKKLDKFFGQYPLIKYKKGKIICTPETKIDNVLFVKSGYVRLYALSKDGEEFTVNFFNPVFYLSLIYAIYSINSPYYMETMTAVELYEVPKEDVISFIRNEPDLNFDLMLNVLEVFHKFMKNGQHLIQGTAYSKVASILLSLAESYGVSKGNGAVLNFATTHRVLASLTGIARETTSLQILKLKEKGIIQNKGSFFIINDLERLKKEAEV